MSSNLQFPNLTLLSVKDDQMQLRKKHLPVSKFPRFSNRNCFILENLIQTK